MKYKEIARRIYEAKNNNTLTFFVGAGVSRCSKLPSWSELIEQMCIEMGRTVPENKKFSSDEYLSIPQMFYYSIHDENKYRDFVKKKIEIPDVVPNDIHRWMIKFNPVSFLTTNYDKLLETAAVKYCKTYKCIACDKEVASINGDRFILKVHGDIEHKNFVLKEEDYLRYEEHFKLTSTLMRSVFSTNTVVFIGYRIGDYNVKLIIDWVKHVLKDRFHPIFIRVEKEPLGKEELKYYESRGLEVVELSKIATAKEIKNYSSDDYTARYVDILKYLEAAGEMKKISNSDEESFLILYSRLKPLDKLNALRISDIQNSLSGCCIVDKGEIFLTKEQEGLFRRFLSIKRLSKDERKDISKSKWEKYRLISRVLNKARIYKVRVDDKITDIYDPLISYADQRCISIDYFGMESYCKNDYIEINAKSRKAFYLTRLHKYEEALGSFLEIAREAFGQKEYVHYYIAVINIIVLNKLLMNPMIKNYSGIKYDIDDGIITWDHEYELFDSMPQEFKREYQFLRDLGTSAVLFRYGYEASVDAKKLEDAISKHTIELGMTSSDKVIFNVNEYIHFLLGNGICLDVFTEYRSAVCNLMEKLVLKYVDQQKKELFSINPFGDTYNNIYFDQYDFYCFIRFFRANELVSVFERSGCKTIDFHNITEIEKAIHNLFMYMERLLNEARGRLEIEGLASEIETCLALTRYMNLSESTIIEICRFIFKYNIRTITIDQKVRFLYCQINNRHISNLKIQKILENTLIMYLDERINAILEGKSWDMYSGSSVINYPNIADCFKVYKENYYSRKLNQRVSKIIDNQIDQMLREVVGHYLSYISKNQKKRLEQWMVSSLKNRFDFRVYTLLISTNPRKAKDMSNNLYDYLQIIINRPKNNNKSAGVKVYPIPVDNQDLINVGYWCMCGLLDSKEFKEFIGIEPEFDFLIDSMNFDYSQFDIKWILQMTGESIKNITKKVTVKNKIMKIIVQEIKKDEIKQTDREKLVKILGDYFSD